MVVKSKMNCGKIIGFQAVENLVQVWVWDLQFRDLMLELRFVCDGLVESEITSDGNFQCVELAVLFACEWN